MSRILTVPNQKGGVTKTTSAVQIAGFLANKGNKVLFIDIDPQGNATLGFGKGLGDYELSTFDLFVNDKNDKNDKNDNIKISDIAIPVWNGENVWNIDLVPCNIQLCTIEISAALGEIKIPLDMLKRKLIEVENKYDYVVIDTPPSFGAFALNGVIASDRFVVPIDGGNPFALIGFVHLYNNLEKIRRNINRKLRPIGFYRSRWNDDLKLSKNIWNLLSTNYPNLAMDTIIGVNIRVSEAMAEGKHISVYDENAKTNEGFLRLTEEILNRWESAVW